MKMKECKDAVDIIIQLEGGELLLEDAEDLQRLINLCEELAGSKGYYGRLLIDLQELDVDELDFPILI